ncbi:MAG: RraA family protein [Gaiellales bacterium]
MGETPTTAAIASGVPALAQAVVGLGPAWLDAAAVGPAFTVTTPGGDNLAIHLAVAQAAPGDVVVVEVSPRDDGVALVGDIVARAAALRGIAGIVVDGPIRDRAAIAALGFPVFHRGTSPIGPAKVGPVRVGARIAVQGVSIEPGDLVCCDADGIVVVGAARAGEAIAAAADVIRREAEVERRIEAGETTVEIFDLEVHE